MPIVDDYQDDARFAPVFWSTTHLRGRFSAAPRESTGGGSDRSLLREEEPARESIGESDQLPNADDDFFSYTIPARNSYVKKRVSGRKPNRGTAAPATPRTSTTSLSEEGEAVEESPVTKKQGAVRATSSVSMQERLFLRQQILSQSFQQQKQQRVPLGAVLQRQNGEPDLSEPTPPQQREENDAEDDDMFFG